MPNVRVVPFGLGPIGSAIVKQLVARPGFKIVGAIDIDPAKVGRDLGDVVGLPKRLGVKVSGEAVKTLKSASEPEIPFTLELKDRAGHDTPSAAAALDRFEREWS